MKKLKLAIIGQGRSGKNIHGKFYLSERNKYFDVGYVVDADPAMRERVRDLYAGCTVLSDYTELFGHDDIDLVVNASYSDMHYPITKDLLEHGFNVLTEKPFAKTYFECETLINTAKKNGKVLAVFQNTQHAPFYLDALKKAYDGTLGDVKQISIRYNAFARRWDWQTLQKKVGGSAYNTGPHPIAMALGFLGFDENVRVEYSKLDTALTSGDAEDYVKIILTAPGKPVVDIEMNSIDAFSDYNLKLQGSRGTFKSTPRAYKMKYIVEGENPPRPVIEESLRNEEGMPVYCSEKLVAHEEEGEYDGTAFDVGTAKIYEEVYYAITEGKPLTVTCEQAAQVIRVIETTHATSPLPVKYT
ncbi:MAG: Gfo/Idh/MocA family oxidoreductase [Clostridia bacterium]|nr:Gfo/Idh/MocA family oxidoreductase [Clostridia bacterium]